MREAPYANLSTHVPRADEAVRVARVEDRAVGGPADRRAVGRRRVLAHGRELGLELVDDDLALQIPDLDRERGGGAEPVAVRREDERVDDVARVERIQTLALVEVPEHGRAVLAAGRAERAVGRDGHGVQVPGMTIQVRAQLAVREG